MESFSDFIKDPQLQQYISLHANFYEHISEKDLNIVFNAIDKTDYTCTGANRWLDLEYILDQLMETSKKVVSIKLVSQQETFPPRNLYKFVF